MTDAPAPGQPEITAEKDNTGLDWVTATWRLVPGIEIGEPLQLPLDYRSVQVAGELGDGIVIEASNDGQHYSVLNNSQYLGHPLKFDKPDLRKVEDTPRKFIRPRATGAATNVTVILAGRPQRDVDIPMGDMTTKEIADVVGELDSFLKRWNGVAQLAKRLKALRKLLAEEGAIRGRVEALRKEEAGAKALIAEAAAAKEQLDGINAELAAHAERMKATHAETVEKANAEAQRIVAEARTEGEQHKSDARAAAEAEARAAAERDAGEISAREARLAELGHAIETKQAALDEIKASIAALRAQIVAH